MPVEEKRAQPERDDRGLNSGSRDASSTGNVSEIRAVLRKRTCTSCRGSGIGGYTSCFGEAFEQICRDCLGNGQVLVTERVVTTMGQS